MHKSFNKFQLEALNTAGILIAIFPINQVAAIAVTPLAIVCLINKHRLK
ncbi:hypothetical protein PY364_24970 [Kamptonema sp. UHCC 0994]|nr:hypothetical protein [Kamptonema sp. UHCC 0994]